MKKLMLAGAMVCALALSACTSFTPVAASSGTVGAKTGESTATFLFGYLPLKGDNSILAAANNGGIKNVATVDVKTVSYLGLYAKKTTIVTGN